MAEPEIKTLQQVTEAFEKSEAALKALVEKRDAEVKELGKAREETGVEIAKMGERLTQNAADYKGLQERVEKAEGLEAKYDEAMKKLGEMEAKMARPGWTDPGKEAKSIGEQFTDDFFLQQESGKSWSEVVASEKKNGSPPVTVKSFWGERKATLASGASPRFIAPHRIEQIMRPVERDLAIRDLMNVVPIESNSIEYVEETGFAADGAAAGTQDHGAAGPRAEGEVTPEAQMEFEDVTALVRDLGHWIAVTRQALRDKSQLRGYVDGRLHYGLKFKEDAALLYHTGTGDQIQGIGTHSKRQIKAWSTDGAVGDTPLDFIRKMIMWSRVAEYAPDGGVINPVDKCNIDLLKGDDEHYIWVTVPNGGGTTLWRLPFVETNAIAQGEILIGSWALAATLYDRETARVHISEHHADFFTKRKVALLAEESICAEWSRPESFIHGTLDAPPAP